MKVAVGSKNPVKIAAAQAAFAAAWPDEQWEVTGIDVPSGVSNQPKSIRESLTGAKNRALRAMEQLGGDYSVGMEGGIFQEGDLYFDGGWIVVRNKAGVEGFGATSHVLLTDQMVQLINEGKELGEIDDIVFHKTNSKQDMGHFGLMTNGLVLRSHAFKDGIIFALARFLHPDLY